MSYLNTPRLLFSGDFYADTATVNNDVRHYDNSQFEPVFQEPQQGKALYGWWNPTGGNEFNLRNCTVQQITLPDGEQYTNPADDPILGQIVAAPGDKGTGKMLDLDPQWQMSSELWCVKIRIYTPTNELMLEGDLVTAGFRDLQTRQTDGGADNGQPMGGCWTSVLTNLVWGEQSAGSPFLKILRQTTQQGQLAIQLNMYGFYYSHKNGRFSMGRITGCIGPWFEREPVTFAPARRLYGTFIDGQGNTYFNYSNFIVEEKTRRLTLDLGNSFPIDDSMGTIIDTNKYILAISNKPLTNDPSDTPVSLQPDTDFTALGPVDYASGNATWMNTTGGIVMLSELTPDQLAGLAASQLLLLQVVKDQYQLLAREAIQGFMLRADNFNQRLDYADKTAVNFYAYQWGKPLAGVNVSVAIQPKTQALFAPMQTGDGTSKIAVPWINIPVEGLTFGHIALTNADGFTRLPVIGNAIHNPRGYVEGQVYYISYQNNPAITDNAAYSMDAIYVHLRDDYAIPENPTWDDVSEVFIQFGNVYPLMSKFIVNLGSEEAVLTKKEILIYAFTRQLTDTFYMPVTRDLSEAKRRTIVKWLHNPLPGKPEKKQALSSTPATISTDTPLFETGQIKKAREFTEKKNGARAFKKQQ